MRLAALLAAACICVSMAPGSAVADETTVGGVLKFWLYDKSDGHVDYWTTVDDTIDVHVDEDQETYMSAGFSNAILSFYRQIGDAVAVEVQPEIAWRAGATPRLGRDFARSASDEAGVELLRAAVIWYAPADFEVKGGYLKPLFTWDYGYELFWDEQFNAFRSSADGMLGAWHDTGVEIYKSFESDAVSVPAYLYITNGPDSDINLDNNSGLTFMIHVAPELMGGSLKFLGSFGTGKYDDGDDPQHSMTRYAAGADFRQGPFNVRAEFAGATYEAYVTDDVDAEPMGWYAKAFYRPMPELRLLAGISHVEKNWVGSAERDEIYDEWLVGADYFIADGVSVMLTFSSTDGERKAGEDSQAEPAATLEYTRLNLGVRATF